MSDVVERLTEVFRVTFGDETIVLDPAMTADDITAWDSVSHITLIYAIEDEFGVKFSTRDLERLACVGDLIDIVTRRADRAPRGNGARARRRAARTVVYACTDLGYDQIFSPVAPTPGVEFVLFADRRPRLVRGWRWRPLPDAARGLSPTLANRYAKFFPERILPGAELSVYVDANTLILADLTPLVAEFAASGADIGLFRHQERTTLAEELEFGRRVGKIPAADAAKGEAQLGRYRAAGLPPDAGLHRECDHLPPPRQPGARGGDGALVGASSRPGPSATS